MGQYDRKDTIVGIFVALGIGLLMVTIVLLSGDRLLLTSYRRYRVELSQVQGLGPGAIVSLAGIPVGNVRNVDFADDSQVVIRIEVKERFSNRITESTEASVRTQGALGDKYVFLTPGKPGERALADEDLVRAEKSPDLFDVISRRGGEINLVFEALNELTQLLRGLNEEGRLPRLVEVLLRSGTKFESAMSEADLLFKDIRGASDKSTQIKETFTRLANILKKVDDGRGTLGELINDPTVHERLVGLLGEAPRNKFLKPMIRATIKENEKASP